MFDKIIETVSQNYILSVISHSFIKGLKTVGLKIEKL
jgi:hypothetical protein